MEETSDNYERVLIKMAVPNSVIPPAVLREEERTRARNAGQLIFDAFDWSETPEGFEFWNSVAQRLFQIAKTGNHRS